MRSSAQGTKALAAQVSEFHEVWALRGILFAAHDDNEFVRQDKRCFVSIHAQKLRDMSKKMPKIDVHQLARSREHDVVG